MRIRHHRGNLPFPSHHFSAEETPLGLSHHVPAAESSLGLDRPGGNRELRQRLKLWPGHHAYRVHCVHCVHHLPLWRRDVQHLRGLHDLHHAVLRLADTLAVKRLDGSRRRLKTPHNQVRLFALLPPATRRRRLSRTSRFPSDASEFDVVHRQLVVNVLFHAPELADHHVALWMSTLEEALG